MKLVSYRRNGRESWGVAVSGGLVDVGKGGNLRDALHGDGIERAKGAVGQKADVPDGSFDYLPPIDGRAKFIGIGLNYRKHAAEAGLEPPKKPMLFARWEDSHVGHKQPIVLPRESTNFDFEAELAVIIGKEARRVSEADALKYVAGYSCYNDGSIRDWQFHTSQVGLGKNFWHTGSFGPCITTTDEIPDPSALHMVGRLNGKEVQSEGINDLIFNVPQLIAYCSAGTLLRPGDVIITGTPSGVGLARKPPLWMKAGDTFEIEITKIGTLSNTVVAD